MSDKPSQQELADVQTEIEGLPFYQRMIQQVGVQGARKSATRDELWSLVAMLIDQMQKQNKRLAEFERRPALKYMGVWREGRAYGEGTLTTDHGALWFAKRATGMRPGAGDDWQLTCKTRGAK